MYLNHFLVRDNPRKPYYAVLFFILVSLFFSMLYIVVLPRLEGLPALSRNGKEVFSVEFVSFLDCLYFSVTTQTTLGYGDIIPISVSGKTCSIIQAAFGYIYLAFLISVFTSRAVLRSKKLQTYLQTMSRKPLERLKQGKLSQSDCRKGEYDSY